MKGKGEGEDEHQRETREWLTRVLETTGLTPTALAERAGLAASTLTRFLYREVKHSLSARTVAKVAAATGIPSPLTAGEPAGETDPETMLYAVRSARELVAHMAVGAERDGLEAELISQFYDVLMERQRAGQSIQAALPAIRAFIRRARAR